MDWKRGERVTLGVSEVCVAGRDDFEACTRAAGEAFGRWRDLPAPRRGKVQEAIDSLVPLWAGQGVGVPSSGILGEGTVGKKKTWKKKTWRNPESWAYSQGFRWPFFPAKFLSTRGFSSQEFSMLSPACLQFAHSRTAAILP